MKKKRVIAMYLPQFHPTKDNDEWWGKGFTEWTNVTKAKPLFRKHYQPHLPTDLGFYDLRVSETRIEQAEMAKQYGIDGFCYYHYWFHGKRLLERPFNEVLESKEPNFPFMLCWANESWTRAWDDSEHKILIKQEYSREDDYNHINYLLSVFEDPRYIRIDGKPVFIIYRSTNIPHLEEMIKFWREEATKKGMELYICRFESYGEEGEIYQKGLFDASLEFQPHSLSKSKYNSKNLGLRAINKISRSVIGRNIIKNTRSYPGYVDYISTTPEPSYKCYPCVVPMWDNTARKGRSFFAFVKSTPQSYKKWLKYALNRKNYSKEENLVIINAWNEWAEGNHLEPCRKWGHQYLEATKDAIDEYNQGK
ncbi:glycoside hydrolase family 99-like domain-containing protein [Dysgonomonas capnocytophagoides]|uniref:glycoside hydrolase family 99-like domain-containing protein n=1 Tax=Dysgonomonas capnocytophagoides TaxID=45254 RepID=UPI003340C6E2